MHDVADKSKITIKEVDSVREAWKIIEAIFNNSSTTWGMYKDVSHLTYVLLVLLLLCNRTLCPCTCHMRPEIGAH